LIYNVRFAWHGQCFDVSVIMKIAMSMSYTTLRQLAAVVLAATAFGGHPASAIPITETTLSSEAFAAEEDPAITGSIMFSDGFTSLSDTNTAVVSDLFDIDVGSSTLAQACSGVFATGGACIPSIGTFASSFVLNNPIDTQIVYSYNNFVFTVTALVGAITRTGLTCSNGTCNDALAFTGTGTVTGPGGFAPGNFSMVWTAQGSCTAAAGAAVCAPETATGTWQARVSAIPEPTTLALLGFAIVFLGFVRRPSRR
jgi:hypothetical protein